MIASGIRLGVFRRLPVRRGYRLSGGLSQRPKYMECGPPSGLRLQGDATAHVTHDFRDERESQACALTTLGRKIRYPDFSPNSRVDTGSGIGDDNMSKGGLRDLSHIQHHAFWCCAAL